MANQQDQQMAIITEMIATARQEFNHNGFIYLLWGWLVFIASLSQYFLLHANSQYNGLPWLLMPLGALVQIVTAFAGKKNNHVKTHVGRIIGYAWGAFGISLFIVLSMSNKLEINTMPLVMVLYAIGIFISGGALRVRVMIWGAVACWAIAAISFFADYPQQLLLLAAAVLIAYIIPGYVLNRRYRNVQPM
jgi:hypothetical protein